MLVFDFGTELYVWQGKAVKPERRKMGVKLARQLYEKGYDYSACDINPMSPLSSELSSMVFVYKYFQAFDWLFILWYSLFKMFINNNPIY